MSEAKEGVTRRTVRGGSSTSAQPTSTDASRTLMKGKDVVDLTQVPFISLLDRHDKEELVASGPFTAVAICGDQDRVKIELTIQNTDTGKSLYCVFVFGDEQDEIELKPRESTVVQVFEAHGFAENDIDQGAVHCISEDQKQSYYFGFDGESVIGNGKSDVHGLDCSVAGIFNLMNI
ncbi:hypothetical protein ACA910_020817 [Epithemia clementina (nom. ined.)]